MVGFSKDPIKFGFKLGVEVVTSAQGGVLTKEDCHEFDTSLGYRVNSRLTWATK